MPGAVLCVLQILPPFMFLPAVCSGHFHLNFTDEETQKLRSLGNSGCPKRDMAVGVNKTLDLTPKLGIINTILYCVLGFKINCYQFFLSFSSHTHNTQHRDC